VSRLRSQEGFTLPELMVAMSISLMTLLGVLGVLDVSVKQTNAIAGRVNATQRSRIVMDTITRQLRSQVCYSATVPALVAGTADSVKFHVDLSSGATPIQQREIVFDATTKTMRERTFPGSGTPVTFPATPTRNRLLLDDVVRRPAPDAAIFRYYAYNTEPIPRPDTQLPVPLNATDLARVAKIDVGFVTLPPGVKSTLLKPAAGAVTLQNEIYVRVADPNDPAPTPTCA
jgi:prepilin-type N-terminal cleavage/methylation domain-containing protein